MTLNMVLQKLVQTFSERVAEQNIKLLNVNISGTTGPFLKLKVMLREYNSLL